MFKWFWTVCSLGAPENPAEFDLKSQVHDFGPKLHDTKFSAITTLLLKGQFEIAEFSQYQYLIDLLAGSLKSGNKNLLHLCICSEIIRVISILNERAARVRFEITSMN